MTPTMLSVKELAARWNIDRKTVLEAVNARTIPSVRLGRVIRIPLGWVQSQEQGRVVPDGSTHVG